MSNTNKAKSGRKPLNAVMPVGKFTARQFQQQNSCSLPTAYNYCNAAQENGKIRVVEMAASGRGRKVKVYQAS